MGYSDGVVELVDVSGSLLYRYDTGHSAPIRLIAATNNYEEIKFVTLAEDKLLRVHSLEMSVSKKNYTVETGYWGQQTSRAMISVTLEAVTPLFTDAAVDLTSMRPVDNNPLFIDANVTATSLIFYVRSGTKYWLLGDSAGGISLHHFNGTFLKRNSASTAPITALDRFGQYVVFAAGNSIGTFQMPAMFTQLTCEEHVTRVTDLLIDLSTSTSIVFAAFGNGDVLAYDTRHVIAGETVCKTVWSYKEKEALAPLHLGGVKSGVAIWGSNGVLGIYSGVFSLSGMQTAYLPFPSDSTVGLFKSTRMTTGGYLLSFAATNDTVHIYESLPGFHMGQTQAGESGTSRLLL